jgi:hypothetical protein
MRFSLRAYHWDAGTGEHTNRPVAMFEPIRPDCHRLQLREQLQQPPPLLLQVYPADAQRHSLYDLAPGEKLYVFANDDISHRLRLLGATAANDAYVYFPAAAAIGTVLYAVVCAGDPAEAQSLLP